MMCFLIFIIWVCPELKSNNPGNSKISMTKCEFLRVRNSDIYKGAPEL